MDTTFWSFINNMKNTISACMAKNYFDAHGTTGRTKRIWALTNVFVPLNRYFRVTLLFFVFGPVIFAYFIIPSYVAVVFLIAHFNYVTHKRNQEGNFEIFNLDHNAFYATLNFLTTGLYYHKNHHRQCSFIDPRKVNPVNNDPMVSYVYNR